MGLTHYALEQMGFRRRREGERLSAQFSCVYAFEVQGISPSAGLLIADAGSIDSVDYRVAVCDSLNDGAKRVANDDFADDEAGWVKEHKCTPPYLLIHIGPTSVHEMTADFLKEESFGLRTYDAFIPARQELRDMEAKVVPRLLSALSCVFGSLRNPVRFRELERAVAGKSLTGVTVFDFGLEFRAEMRVGQAVPAVELTDLLKSSTDLAGRMNAQVARYYHLALKEDDPLKRFLYLFLTVERQTHAAFKTIDHGAHMLTISRAPERVQLTAASFLGSQPERWKSLQDRFTWCALTVWNHVTDEDVANFSRVKKVRDQIAHGEIAAPPADAVALVERVAAKLQLAPMRADA
jgi:hypothetical protein